ncbi:MAG: hypothetical protein ACRCV3_02050 [Desulfovibrionaceae bacterium]
MLRISHAVSFLFFLFTIIIHMDTYALNIVVDVPTTGDIIGSGGVDIIVINSELSGRILGMGGNDSIIVNAGARVFRDIVISDDIASRSTINIMLEARIEGGITGGSGSENISNFGIINNGISIGDGNNTILLSGDRAQIGTSVSGSSIQAGSGNDTLNVESGIINSVVMLGDGENIVNINKGTIAELFTGKDKDTYEIMNATIGGISSGGGGDIVTLSDSIVTGSITTGREGEDFLTMSMTSILGDVTLGKATGFGGTDVMSFEEVNVVGNIRAEEGLDLSIRTYSLIQGSLFVGENFLLLGEGLTVEGTVRSGENSVYQLMNSRFMEKIDLYGSTSMALRKSIVEKDIIVQESGGIAITVENQSVLLGNIDASRNLGSTNVTVRSSSIINNILFGTGANTLTTNVTELNGVSANNLTLNSTNTSFLTDITIEQALNASIINSSLKNLITTDPNSINIVSLENNAIVEGSLILRGITSIAMYDSMVLGAIHTGVGNDSVEMVSSYAGEIVTGEGNDMVLLLNSEIAGDINLGAEVGDSLRIRGKTAVGSRIIASAGNVLLQDSVVFTKQATSTETEAFFTVGGMTVENNAYIEVGKNNLFESLLLQVDLLENKNKLGNPLFITYANYSTGEVTTLDLSKMNAYIGIDEVLLIRPIKHFGIPLQQIENVLVTNASFTPKLLNNFTIAGGYLYALEENLNTSTEDKTVWNLNQIGISPTNHGYAAIHSGVRNYNTKVWRGLGKRQQEFLYTNRDEKGKTPIGAGFLDTVNVWATGMYGNNSYSPFNRPELSEHSANVLFGVDFTNVSLEYNLLLNVGLFGGIGFVWAGFEELDARVKFDTKQTGFTLGISGGLEYVFTERTGKFFVQSHAWYTDMKNQLDSNIFYERNSWKSLSFNADISVGYSAYIQGTIITPSLDLVFLYTAGNEYVTPDNNYIEFTKDVRVNARLGISVGQSTSIGLTPYVRTAIEYPIFLGKGGFIVSGDEEYSYNTKDLITEIGGGLHYKGVFSGFEFLLSTDAFVYVGASTGIELSLRVGFSF